VATKSFFLLPVTEEAENVLTLLAVDLTDLADFLLGDCFAANSASSSALAFMYLRNQSLTPLRFL